MVTTSLQRGLIAALILTTLGTLSGYVLYFREANKSGTNVNYNNNNREVTGTETPTNSNINYSADKPSFDAGYAAGTVDGASKSSVVGQRFSPSGTGRTILQYEDGYMQGYIYGCGQSGKECTDIMRWFSKAMEVQGTRYTQ
ncbi:MAG: hypothetical protein V1907_04610 [Candidatus Kerfeldbacteria bacterium]